MLNHKGFAHIEAFVILIMLIAVGGTGYFVYTNNKPIQCNSKQTCIETAFKICQKADYKGTEATYDLPNVTITILGKDSNGCKVRSAYNENSISWYINAPMTCTYNYKQDALVDDFTFSVDAPKQYDCSGQLANILEGIYPPVENVNIGQTVHGSYFNVTYLGSAVNAGYSGPQPDPGTAYLVANFKITRNTAMNNDPSSHNLDSLLYTPSILPTSADDENASARAYQEGFPFYSADDSVNGIFNPLSGNPGLAKDVSVPSEVSILNAFGTTPSKLNANSLTDGVLLTGSQPNGTSETVYCIYEINPKDVGALEFDTTNPKGIPYIYYFKPYTNIKNQKVDVVPS